MNINRNAEAAAHQLEPIDLSASTDCLEEPPHRVSLTLTANTDISQLISSLQSNVCLVLFVSIYESFLRKYTPKKIAGFFYYARLPNLLGLKLEHPDRKSNLNLFGTEDPQELSIPVEALTSLLRTAKKLQYLLFYLKMVGNREDYKKWGKTFENLSRLQCVGMVITVTEDPPETTTTAIPTSEGDAASCNSENILDPLIRSLSKLGDLTDMVIKGVTVNQASLGSLQSSSLRDLCRLPKLRSLCLLSFTLSDDNVKAIAEAMETSTVTKDMFIHCIPELDGARALSRMFRRNKTLTDVIIFTSRYEHEVDAALASGVAASESLEEFSYQGGLCHKMSIASQTSFRDALKAKYNIKKVTIGVGDDEKSLALEKEMHFYLDLNKAGRKKLLNDQSVQRDYRWIAKLAGENTGDLSTVHYYMTADPFLCLRPRERNTKAFKKSRAKGPSPTRRRILYRSVKYRRVCYR